MIISFFITENNEVYIDMKSTIDDIVFNWAAKNKYEFGRKTSFKIKLESPLFNNLKDAEAWLSANNLIRKKR